MCTTDRRKWQVFVAASSLVAAVAILVVAVLHLNYLFEAFVRKKSLQNALSSGRKLDPYHSWLWFLLYTFGESPTVKHDTVFYLHEFSLIAPRRSWEGALRRFLMRV